ncbi:transcription factor S [Sphaceloma murrayae]|uniref:DNA-directed RNA polymerase III subunit RPC10 n=1 Tax=Sphaceloma murrayae TaxID=2082308 RepID=A0A2K1QYJ6_9PEZI|nr:transcription factor S [Sphaceloma murrayae]
MQLDGAFYEKKMFKAKEVEDVLGGADSWKNVDKAHNCPSTEAYFRQLQIRSADEPMTTFYKCVKCTKEWREN